MIDVNSNCSRVDAVKALATQLKLQYAAPPATAPADSPAHKVQSDLLAVDQQVKADDAKKAELALAVAKNDVTAAQTAKSRAGADSSADATAPFRGLDVYA